MGSQAMGASLVGFNARAFESYGHDEEQGLNAPVSERATFAYATALNYLLSDRKHHVRLGDNDGGVLGDKNDDACAELTYDFFDARPHEPASAEGAESDPDQLIEEVMTKLACGLPIKGVDLDCELLRARARAERRARLSVRFFQRSTFGDVLDNLRRHYGPFGRGPRSV